MQMINAAVVKRMIMIKIKDVLFYDTTVKAILIY